MNTKSIGVFDSGVGGLSVLRHIRSALPSENLIYFADSLHAPYGNKTPEFIIERSVRIADFMLEQQCKSLVVACNTATAAAISHLRHHYALPILGMEPAVKPAAAVTRTGVVGVLATVGTLKSAQFAALLENYGQHIEVVTQACVGLVECVERGELDSLSTRSLLKGYLKPLLDHGVDTIVLGCTHYPFLKPLIESMIPTHIALVDTGEAVARHLKQVHADSALLDESGRKGSIRIGTNNSEPNAQEVILRLWGGEDPPFELQSVSL